MIILSGGKLKLPPYYAGLTKNDLLMGQALYWFAREINKLLKTHEPDRICAESINIKHPTTMRSIAQFHAAASLIISIWNKDLILEKVHNATIRSVLGIKSFGKKKDIPDEIKKKAKENKVDISKVLFTDVINDMFKMQFKYQDHDIVDSVAVGFTYAVKRL